MLSTVSALTTLLLIMSRGTQVPISMVGAVPKIRFVVLPKNIPGQAAPETAILGGRFRHSLEG